MAEEIADVVKKTSVLLLDVEGTTTSISFVKEKLFPYAAEHARGFLEERWEEAAVRDAVAALRQLSLADADEKRDGVVAVPPEDAPKDEQISKLVDSVKWLMAADRKAGALKLLQGLIWRRGYDKGELQGHVYEDVAGALAAWRAAGGGGASGARSVYVYSSGSTEAQRLLFARSVAGDLSSHLAGHFDTAVGGKHDAASYAAIATDIGCPPQQILFLTDVLKEAEAAREAGLHAALVAREGNAALPPDVPFPVLSSLADLHPPAPAPAAAAAAKRKQEVQEEQPAKVAKATVDDNVKSSTTENNVAVKPAGEMEVDATPSDKTEEDKTGSSETVESVVIAEVTGSIDSVETSPEIQPVVIEEAGEQTDDKTDSKDNKTDTPKEDGKVEKDIAAPAKLENENTQKDDNTTDKEEAMEAEESPPVIEDITDKPTVTDEIVENLDIDPIVEEPLDGVTVDDAEMAELQNVGDVLEKECDEILSKVSNVTNLDNITVKPLLTPISEEATEVDSIKLVTETAAEIESKTKKSETETESTLKTTETEKQCMPKKSELEKESALKINESKVESTPKIAEDKTEPTTKVFETDKPSNVVKSEIPVVKITEVKDQEKVESPKEVPNVKSTEVESSNLEDKESTEKPTSNGNGVPSDNGHVNGDAEAKEANASKQNGNSNGEERLAVAGENGEKQENGNKENGEKKENDSGDGGKESSAGETGAPDVAEMKAKAAAATAPPADLSADA